MKKKRKRLCGTHKRAKRAAFARGRRADLALQDDQKYDRWFRCRRGLKLPPELVAGRPWIELDPGDGI